ncbi:MAG: fused MFS/spermidine synthase [Myxococcales bacterium]|nr:fused MFS/spermidine synthase [Myxococcales bacterium]
MLQAILITAFLEGMSVLVVEIAGARALAPYFGASLHVWTAQITATLLFLALGYGMGGLLCRRGPMALPGVLVFAGIWLALYPAWRTGLLSALTPLGISGGAFAASAALFGPPLACMGAVSPLLINRMGLGGMEGGRAAGSLFFTNTLGGLAGGWLTALVLVPMVPMRWVLAGTGAGLVLLGAIWARARGAGQGVLLLPLLCIALGGLGSTAARAIPIGDSGLFAKVVDRIQSPAGAIHVLEVPGVWRSLRLNGTDQGAMHIPTGDSYHPFSEYLAFASHRYHPDARSALLLGLGCGVLAKRFHGMGMEVTAVEIEPEVTRAAREHFGLPDAVRMIDEDGRAFLRVDQGHYDIIVLDAFAGESSPWYLLTREALQEIKARLAPGGRLVINSITLAEGKTEGLARLEAALLDVFDEAVVFLEPRLPMETEDLINATLVAGADLRPTEQPYPIELNRHVAPFVGDMEGLGPRPARAGGVVDTDDFSSLEMVDADLRLRWRAKVLESLTASVLQD